MREELSRTGISSASHAVVAGLGVALLMLAFNASAGAQAAGQQGPAPSPGKWGRLAPLPEKSEEFSFADVNGKIYLFGGLPESGKPPLGLVQEYDPAADKWTKKKNMPVAIHHAALAAYNGKIYLFGGQGQTDPGGSPWMPLTNTWEYDPVADSWRALAPLSNARTSAVAAEYGGKIYVFGGASVHPGQKVVPLLGLDIPHRSLDTNEAYDPATNTWETRSPMPTARNHAAAGVLNGKIYIIGGRIGAANIVQASNINVVEVYEPVTNKWGAAGLRMPTPRSGMGWATHNGKIWVAGGEIYNSSVFAVIRAVEGYDPVANRWTALPQMLTARHGVNVAAIGNRLYVIGGHVTSDGVGAEAANSDANEVYEFPNER